MLKPQEHTNLVSASGVRGRKAEPLNPELQNILSEADQVILSFVTGTPVNIDGTSFEFKLREGTYGEVLFEDNTPLYWSPKISKKALGNTVNKLNKAARSFRRGTGEQPFQNHEREVKFSQNGTTIDANTGEYVPLVTLKVTEILKPTIVDNEEEETE